jgi:peptidoglycan hydrolase CwlO-like protein
LQLARRLHEEHVREGMEKRDALIAEGHATAARVVSDAQQTQQAQLAGLEQEKQSLELEKQSLERQVDELRSFEKEYREKLRGYIEGQLRELESSNALTAAPAQVAVEAAPAAAPASASAPQFQSAEAAAPAGYGAYPQPTDYPGFAAGN